MVNQTVFNSTGEAETVSLLDRLGRINPSSREVSLVLDAVPERTAWPEEVAGEIVSGLTEAEALTLIPSEHNPGVELYLSSRITRRGNGKRYLLMDLQKAPGHFPFRARRDFSPHLQLQKEQSF